MKRENVPDVLASVSAVTLSTNSVDTLGRNVELRRFYRKFSHHKSLVTGMILLLILLSLSVMSMVYTPYNPYTMHAAQRFSPPSFAHPFGTDEFGRDYFSRCVVGGQSAFLVGLIATALSMGIGVLLGFIAGLGWRWLDELIMRLMDGVFAFPGILFAIAIVSVLGPNVIHAILAIGIARIPMFARETRNSVRSVRIKDYITSAKSLGVSSIKLSLFYFLPNILAPLLVLTSTNFAYAVLSEASLSYLGLGTQPPFPSWGRLLMESQRFLTRAPWLALFPGLMIALMVLAFTLLSDGLRDIADPKFPSS